MSGTDSLKRYLEAQETDFETALTEIRNGRKRSHWMWYIFPQLKGLGFSSTSQFYAIQNSEEARSYIDHPVLGQRLIQISRALLKLEESNATAIFGSPDDVKLKSCMTLFSEVSDDPVFEQVLQKFFNGAKDRKTLQLLGH